MVDDTGIELSKVLGGNFCIGCGACQVNKEVDTLETREGIYRPNVDIEDIEDMGRLDGRVCPFANNELEDKINNKLYSANRYDIKEDKHYHKHIGYYRGIYAGYILDNEKRKRATSGGLTKWLLAKLLSMGEINGVIHVVRSGEETESKALFRYDIAKTVEDVYGGSQSAYYTVNFAEVMSRIKRENNTEARYAFVGVPCYCKAVRLLCETDELLSKNIKYVVGIMCGHMKTKNYAKFMAWEAKLGLSNKVCSSNVDDREGDRDSSIINNELSYVNFRMKPEKVKRKDKASDYIFNARYGDGYEVKIRRNKLAGGNYNIPHMKYKACDFCEDVFGYCADIVLGDAWLPKYVSDPRGTNIVVTRDDRLDRIMNNSIGMDIMLDRLKDAELIKSQSSSYSHRVEEIGYRLYLESKNNKDGWVPDKMTKPVSSLASLDREEIQKMRVKIREMSHEYFLKAVDGKDIRIYFNAMQMYIDKLNNKYK